MLLLAQEPRMLFYFKLVLCGLGNDGSTTYTRSDGTNPLSPIVKLVYLIEIIRIILSDILSNIFLV